jgi:hypothetical protein
MSVGEGMVGLDAISHLGRARHEIVEPRGHACLSIGLCLMCRRLRGADAGTSAHKSIVPSALWRLPNAG